MSKLKLTSIQEAAQQLGYKVKGHLSPDQHLIMCLNYLNKNYPELTQVNVDSAFLNPINNKLNPFALKTTEIKNILKDKENE